MFVGNCDCWLTLKVGDARNVRVIGNNLSPVLLARSQAFAFTAPS